MSVNRPHSLLYDAYMGSALWRLRRWWWWLRSDKQCERCRRPLLLHARHGGVSWPATAAPGLAPSVLTVHHRTYRRLGHERRADVELLCWPCHCTRDWWRR